MSANLGETQKFHIKQNAKLEMAGSIFRFVTPALVAVGLWILTGMNDKFLSIDNNMNNKFNSITNTMDKEFDAQGEVLEAIQYDVSKNRITAIKLEARQAATIESFNSYRQTDEISKREMDNEINEINDEIDANVLQLHKLEIKMNGFHINERQ